MHHEVIRQAAIELKGIIDNPANALSKSEVFERIDWANLRPNELETQIPYLIEMITATLCREDAVENKQTPTLVAAKDGHINILTFLLEFHARQPSDSLIAILRRVFSSFEPGFEPLLGDKDRMTPLHYACLNGHIEAVELLLGLPGIPLNEAARYRPRESSHPSPGWTPLMLASNGGHIEVVKLLMKTPGVKTEAHNKSALSLAATPEIKNLFRARLHEEFRALNWDGFYEGQSTSWDHQKAIDFKNLIEKSYRMENPIGPDVTLMMNAAMHGDTNTLKFLVRFEREKANSKVAEHNKTDSLGQTALYFAVHFRQAEAIKFLLTLENIDVNAPDYLGRTPLMVAANYAGEFNERLDIIKMLLQHPRIEIDKKNNYGHTALMQAEQRGYQHIVDLINAQRRVSFDHFQVLMLSKRLSRVVPKHVMEVVGEYTVRPPKPQ